MCIRSRSFHQSWLPPPLPLAAFVTRPVKVLLVERYYFDGRIVARLLSAPGLPDFRPVEDWRANAPARPQARRRRPAARASRSLRDRPAPRCHQGVLLLLGLLSPSLL